MGEGSNNWTKQLPNFTRRWTSFHYRECESKKTDRWRCITGAYILSEKMREESTLTYADNGI